MIPQALPVDAHLGELSALLRDRGAAVLTAQPGAGKTTRVPLFLARDGHPGQVIVTQPRRLAARMVARFVAAQAGCPARDEARDEVGYHVRHERRATKHTKLLFCTEGILLQRLLADPQLSGVGTVILDEFHERSLDADLLFAWLSALRQERTARLRLLVMSATIDSAQIASAMDRDHPAPIIHCEGRAFPVEIQHMSLRARDREAPVERLVRRGVEQLLLDPGDQGPRGDTLVFLPGRREIERAITVCTPLLRPRFDLHALHGSLRPAEQDAALRPGPRPKVIFTTNIAETSVTVEGVTSVIDSGLARVAGRGRGGEAARLERCPISQASAAQRTGRAGRLRPGTCLRLFSKADLQRRPRHDTPEIERLSLASFWLRACVLAGSHQAACKLPWVTAPPPRPLSDARRLLERLDGLGAEPLGLALDRALALARTGLPIRLAASWLRAAQLGVAAEAALPLAVISGAGIWRHSPDHPIRRSSSLADPISDAMAIRALKDGRTLARIDRRACEEARKTATALRDRPREGATPGGQRPPLDEIDENICRSLLAGFPDRLARVEARPGGARALVMAGAGHAELSDASTCREATLVIALDSRTVGRRVVVESAATVEPEWLIEDQLEHVESVIEHRVVEGRLLAWEQLSLHGQPFSRERTSIDPDLGARTLLDEVLRRSPHSWLKDPAALESLRVRLARAFGDEVAALIDDHAFLQDLLLEPCRSVTSFDKLRELPLLRRLMDALGAKVGGDIAQGLSTRAPAKIHLPGGQALEVHYDQNAGAPWVTSRIQDFFGMAEGPKLGDAPLVLRLLAPNKRPVQVTADLAGFWDRHYPTLRRELSRRYPRHDWPEDPIQAQPPKRTKPRRR